MASDLVVIGTGGTFDKVYDPIAEAMVMAPRSFVPAVLAAARIGDARFEALDLVDSLDMTDGYREALLARKSAVRQKRLVIVHGTSRMIETGRYLASRISGRVVILTGALKPYRYDATEAACNLGGAVAAARLLDAGTYLFMHGRVLRPDRARKDPLTGVFTEIA